MFVHNSWRKHFEFLYYFSRQLLIRKLVKYIFALITAKSELPNCLKNADKFIFCFQFCYLKVFLGQNMLATVIPVTMWDRSPSYKHRKKQNILRLLMASVLAINLYKSPINFCITFAGEAILICITFWVLKLATIYQLQLRFFNNAQTSLVFKGKQSDFTTGKQV